MGNIFFWLFTFFASLTQEPTLMGFVFLAVIHEHKNLWALLIVWTIATILSVLIGFAIGERVLKKYPDGKLARTGKGLAAKLEKYFGKFGNIFFLLIIGFFNLPWLNGFIMPWLNMPRTGTVWIVIGDFVWFLLEFAAIAGVIALTPNFWIAVTIVVMGGMVGTYFIHRFRNKAVFMR